MVEELVRISQLQQVQTTGTSHVMVQLQLSVLIQVVRMCNMISKSTRESRLLIVGGEMEIAGNLIHLGHTPSLGMSRCEITQVDWKVTGVLAGISPLPHSN